MCFKDLEKALDSVSQGILGQILQEYWILGLLLWVIHFLYRVSLVCITSSKSDSFQVRVGPLLLIPRREYLGAAKEWRDLV